MRSTEPLTIGGEELAGNGEWLSSFWAAQGSALVRNLLGTARHFAMSNLGVRIVGERGSGRLQLARLIHAWSSRADRGFHQVFCADIDGHSDEEYIFGVEGDGGESGAIPGVLETARGGTLYLNDYYALPEEIRSRLWRAIELQHFRRTGGLQDVMVDLRVIAGVTKSPATPAEYQHPDSETARKIGPICINIPPLRERREDIDSLIYLFLGEYYAIKSKTVTAITQRALDLCRYYDWPGNIYELRTVVHHSAARCTGEELDVRDLPEFLCQDHAGRQAIPARHT
jgi:DNA-binding NtrC family response regulator